MIDINGFKKHRNHHILSIFSIFIISVCLTGCYCLGGCLSLGKVVREGLDDTLSVGVSLFDTNRVETNFIEARYPLIIYVDNEKREFLYLEMPFRGTSNFVVKIMDYEGNLIGDKKGLYKKDILFSMDNTFSLSPDRKYLPHINRDGLLYIHNIETGESSVVNEDVNLMAGIMGMDWLSDRELLIIKRYAVTKFDMYSKSVTKEIYLRFNQSFQMSPSKRYLAVVDGREVPNLKVLDLKTLEILESRISYENMWHVCWSPSEKFLGYIKNRRIIIHTRATGYERPVKILPDNTKCYYLSFLNEDTLIYRYGTKDNPDERYTMRALNLKTGKERVLIRRAIFRGNIYVVDNGNKILSEVGYNY